MQQAYRLTQTGMPVFYVNMHGDSVSPAQKYIIDEFGVKKIVVDQEMKEHIQQALMLQIYLKYDHLETPHQKY